MSDESAATSLLPPPPYRIVSANKSQLYAMERLVNECLGHLVEFDREFFNWIFETEAVEAFVALHDTDADDKEDETSASVVGCVIGIAQQDKRGKRFGHVQALCVAKQHRRHGLGNQLMTSVERWFDVFGAHYSALYAAKKDKPLVKFYCKLGYGNSKIVKKYYAKRHDAILFKKPLEDR